MDDILQALGQFHFLHPNWLWGLVPLFLVFWISQRFRSKKHSWQSIVDPRLLPLLLSNGQAQKNSRFLIVSVLTGILVVLALANPTWQRQAQNVHQTDSSRVIVFDLSRSMLAADVKPSRLSRARFKVEDILSMDTEGQIGLIVFSGNAFVVTPLTRDVDTIRAQLKALEPSIMPSQGSRVDLGLRKARDLLQQAGVSRGQILLISDGAEGNKAQRVASEIYKSGYQISVLAVGTDKGAPIPNDRGGLMRDHSGQLRMIKLDAASLQVVAEAGGGHYRRMSNDDSDITYLLSDVNNGTKNSQHTSLVETQNWQAKGPYLVLLILPLAAFAFRRGYFLTIALAFSLSLQPDSALAIEFDWQDLWQRNDQQVDSAIKQGDFAKAVERANSPDQKGSAEYKLGDYKSAAESFAKTPDSEGHYNRGNALAKLGQYEEAIKAYDESLKQIPDMADAIANKKAVENFLKKQQEQQQEEEKQSSNSDENKPSDENEGEQKDDNQESSGGDKSQSKSGEQNSSGQQQSDGAKNDFDEASEALDDKKDQSESEQPQQGNAEKEGVQPESQGTPPSNNAANEEQASAEPVQAEALSDEEKMAAEQWLRKIPDDPGGLLRRKFLYQYRQNGEQRANTGQNW